MDKTFTLRIREDLYNQLRIQSEFLGIPIAAIIKFELYKLKNVNLTIIETDNNNCTRMSIKFPEHFFELISENAKLYNTSINQYINSIIYYFLNN